jgi:hypothetical protein
LQGRREAHKFYAGAPKKLDIAVKRKLTAHALAAELKKPLAASSGPT